MTTEPHVPSDAEVRDQFATRMAPHLDETRRRSFDRWLARHDARIKADAWAEGHRAGHEHGDPMGDTDCPPPNPHRIEGEA